MLVHLLLLGLLQALLCCWPCSAHPIASAIASPGLHDPRDETANSAPSETSVYICQNFNWQPPCLLIFLGPSNNGQQDFWMAPAPGGPGPFGDGNYTIGSWGPSEGVTTFWVDHQANMSELLTYPGTGNVDSYWGSNVWTWYPYWDEAA